jgi:hypothetical protein
VGLGYTVYQDPIQVEVFRISSNGGGGGTTTTSSSSSSSKNSSIITNIADGVIPQLNEVCI